MKILSFVMLCFILISCKNDKQDNLPKKHNPFEHIDQNIENVKALEFYFQGLEFFEKGNLISAKESLNRSFEIEQSPITLNELGTIEFTKKDYAAAIKYYNQSRTLDNTYWGAYINEARCHARLNEFSEGENILLSLKESCKSSYWITYADYHLAVIYFNSRQGCDKVYDFLEKAIDMKSDSELSNQYLDFRDHVEKSCD